MTILEREQRQDKVVKLYQENKSINQISKELNISWDTVKKDLLLRDITITKRNNQFQNSNVSNTLFQEINDSNSAYWLGFLYADGSIRKDRNEICLELQEKDIKAVQDFHKYCNNNNTIRKHIIKRNNKEYVSYVSSFSNQQVKNNLIKLGCVPQKSLILTCPTEQQVPQDFIYDFVRGYIDGDGYIQYDFNKHRYRIVIAGTKDFLVGIMNRCKWFEYCIITPDKNSNIYTLTLSNKENVLKQLEKLYENSYYHLDRKFEIYSKAKLGA